MTKLGIIHTTYETFHSIEKLAKERIPNLEVLNLPDERVLAGTVRGESMVNGEEDWIRYAEELEKLGADVILSASATIADHLEAVRGKVGVPVYRIDEAMAEQAIEMGGSIIVFGITEETMKPTVELIRQKAKQKGVELQLDTVLIKDAFSALQDSNKRQHDRLIIDTIDNYSQESDLMVLAEAHMAEALYEETHEHDKLLTSPVPAIEKIQQDMNLGSL